MTALFLALLVLLVLMNGLFVAAEFALSAPARAGSRRSPQGEAGAEEALEQLDKIDESLAACQFGITLASIGIGFLGEPAIADLLEPLLGDSHRRVTRSPSPSPSRSPPRFTSRRRAGAEDACDHQRGADGSRCSRAR